MADNNDKKNNDKNLSRIVLQDLSILDSILAQDELKEAMQKLKDALKIAGSVVENVKFKIEPVKDTKPTIPRKSNTIVDAPPELKLLLDLFNKSDSDKMELSKKLFNNTVDEKDIPVSKEFNSIFSFPKPDAISYMESIIDAEYTHTFDKIKARMEGLYIKFILCFFLLFVYFLHLDN